MARRPNIAMRKRQREQRKAEKAEEKRAKRFARADSQEDNSAVKEDPGVPGAENRAESRREASADLFVDRALDPATALGGVATTRRLQAYCKVCKVVNDHTLVALKAGSTKRVKCSACADEHPYRASKPASRKRVRKSKDAAPDDGSFDSLVSGRDLSEASPYDMAAVFSDRTIIDHPAFGVGVVARVLLDRKIEVMFREGAKVLAHGR